MNELRAEIRQRVLAVHDAENIALPFVPGKSPVPVSGRTFDGTDVATLVEASLDFWLTAGPYAEKFEKKLSRYVGSRYAILCNSGSSANLLAISALTSRTLGDRALVTGNEVITVAAGFPTTVNPIIQNGLVPVFVDVDSATLNIRVDQLEAAVSSQTRALVIAHTLGNPFNIRAVSAFCKKYGLWLVEDNCDALGSQYGGVRTGTFGDLATVSFYPAHHITTGEGGAVLTSSPLLKRVVESFRDWGRHCWCAPGEAGTCGKRYEWQLGQLPVGYDHKYVYNELGYNLKMTDLQAAVGLSQMGKLDQFVRRRIETWNYYRSELERFSDHLQLPAAEIDASPSWFGFSMGVRSTSYTRHDLVTFLDGRKIQSRFVFGGNMVRQPSMEGRLWRAVGELPNSDQVMNDYLWIGVYPGVTNSMREFVVETLADFHRAL